MYKVNLIQEYCKNLTNIVKPIKLKYNTTTTKCFTEQYKPNIKFFKDDTLNVALKYNNPLILILADESRPGGTWISGMQEETLFRRTELFGYLTPDLYPIKEDELILVQNVGIFSTKEDFNTFNIICRADFIACPGLKNYTGDQSETIIFKNKIRLILNTAIKYNYKNIILGALGTGAFGCNKKDVAICFRDVIKEYHPETFSNIVFAITGKTCDIFKDIISG